MSSNRDKTTLNMQMLSLQIMTLNIWWYIFVNLKAANNNKLALFYLQTNVYCMHGLSYGYFDCPSLKHIHVLHCKTSVQFCLKAFPGWEMTSHGAMRETGFVQK